MKAIETEGKTVEQAIELGLYKLGLSREQVTIQILDQGSLFSKAKVKLITGEQTEGEKELQKFFEEFITATGLSCYVSVEEKENEYLVNLTGNDVGVLIGKHGDVISNIQFLTSIMLGRKDNKRVIVDSSNYNARREESLKILARSTASRALREKKPIKMEYMNARERKIIHEELSANQRVTTESQGKEPRRYVVVTPVRVQKEESKKGLPPRDEND